MSRFEKHKSELERQNELAEHLYQKRLQKFRKLAKQYKELSTISYDVFNDYYTNIIAPQSNFLLRPPLSCENVQHPLSTKETLLAEFGTGINIVERGGSELENFHELFLSLDPNHQPILGFDQYIKLQLNIFLRTPFDQVLQKYREELVPSAELKVWTRNENSVQEDVRILSEVKEIRQGIVISSKVSQLFGRPPRTYLAVSLPITNGSPQEMESLLTDVLPFVTDFVR